MLTLDLPIQEIMSAKATKNPPKRKHNTRRKSDKKRQERSVSEESDSDNHMGRPTKSKQAQRRAEKAKQKDKTTAQTPANVLRQAQLLADARKNAIATAVEKQSANTDTVATTPMPPPMPIPTPMPIPIPQQQGGQQQDEEMMATPTTSSPPPQTDNAHFFEDPDYIYTFELMLNDQILKEQWKLRDICDHFFGLYGLGDHMTSSLDFKTGIAQLSFLTEESATNAQGYRGDWGLPLEMVASMQHNLNKELEFAGAHGAMLTHFSQFDTPKTIAEDIFKATLVKPLGVLLLGEAKETALISVASLQDLNSITRRRRFVLCNHLVRIVPKRPFRAAIVYVSNLPTQATEDKVENMLARWGVPPLFVVLPTNLNSGKALGFGFITYRTKAQADKLIALDGKHNVGGHVLTFERAKRRKRKSQSLDRGRKQFIDAPKGPTSMLVDPVPPHSTQ